MNREQSKDGDYMGPKLILTVLFLGVIVSGCVSKPQETQAPPDAVEDAAEDIEELPDIGDVTEEELTPEPDLDINDTVDLGSLL